MTTEPTWVTRDQAAARLGVASSTVGAMAARGDLVRRPGGRRGVPSIDAASVEHAARRLDQQRAEAVAREQARARHGRPPDDAHDWLTAGQVAAVVGLTSAWVNLRAREGRIPATRAGGRWWVRREHAEQVARARRAQSTTDL